MGKTNDTVNYALDAVPEICPCGSGILTPNLLSLWRNGHARYRCPICLRAWSLKTGHAIRGTGDPSKKMPLDGEAPLRAEKLTQLWRGEKLKLFLAHGLILPRTSLGKNIAPAVFVTAANVRVRRRGAHVLHVLRGRLTATVKAKLVARVRVMEARLVRPGSPAPDAGARRRSDP
jgi:hypothetical protein